MELQTDPCLLVIIRAKTNTVLSWIVAEAIINFEDNFARKYSVKFSEYKYYWESNCSSRSVIEMMPFRYEALCQRVRKQIYTLVWEGDYSNIRSFRNEYSFEFTLNSSEYFSSFLDVYDTFEEVVKFSDIKLTNMT